jgi:hypothetical protein
MEDRSNQNRSRDKPNPPCASLGSLARWATTPPQAIGVYLICFILVAGLSFYVGTLKPKKAIGTAPPPASIPRN